MARIDIGILPVNGRKANLSHVFAGAHIVAAVQLVRRVLEMGRAAARRLV